MTIEKLKELQRELNGDCFGGIPMSDTACEYLHSLIDAEIERQSASQKQSPKRPKGISVSHEGRLANCPNLECNKLVWQMHGSTCKYCGQLLKWEEEK